MIAALAELENLKAKLERVQQQSKQHQATTTEEEEARIIEKVVGDKDPARVVEVEETLKGVFEAQHKLQVEGQQTKDEHK